MRGQRLDAVLSKGGFKQSNIRVLLDGANSTKIIAEANSCLSVITGQVAIVVLEQGQY